MGPGAEVSADSDTEKKHPVVGWTVKFQVSGNFLVFTKKSPFWVINWNYVVGIGEPPLRDARFLHFPQKEKSLSVKIDQISPPPFLYNMF